MLVSHYVSWFTESDGNALSVLKKKEEEDQAVLLIKKNPAKDTFNT